MQEAPGHDTGLLVQEIVYLGLDALRAAARLELCAYLHSSAAQGPQLLLGAPDLSSIEPTEAFSLFTALRDTLEGDHDGTAVLSLAGYSAYAVTSAGSASRGLHVFGRKSGPIEEDERDVLVALATRTGGLTHSMEAFAQGAPRPAPGAPIRVAVETVAGRARAEVAVPLGEEIRAGTGESTTPLRAVAAAVTDAVDASHKLIEALEGEIAGERAVLVLLSDQFGAQGLGSALIGEGLDPLNAAAAAALDAASRVGRART